MHISALETGLLKKNGESEDEPLKKNEMDEHKTAVNGNQGMLFI